MKAEDRRYDRQYEQDEPIPESETQRSARPSANPAPGGSQRSLISDRQAEDLSRRWQDVQFSFVDDPRSAVKRAADLVNEALDAMQRTFNQEQTALEQQRSQGAPDPAETEQLRMALQRFRSFFQRLLGTPPGSEARAGSA